MDQKANTRYHFRDAEWKVKKRRGGRSKKTEKEKRETRKRYIELNREKIREYWKYYYQLNKRKIIERNKRYYREKDITEEIKLKRRLYWIEYRKAHPPKRELIDWHTKEFWMKRGVKNKSEYLEKRKQINRERAKNFYHTHKKT